MRARAIHAAAVAMLVCAVAIGCGSDEPASKSSGTLTPTQYAEIERMYRAMVPLDGLADNDDARSIRRVATGTARACRQVDQTDPLLATMVDGCQRITANLAGLTRLDCTNEQNCGELMTSYVATMRDLLEALRRSERVVEQEVGAPACRDALLTPDQTEALEKAVDAFDRFNAAAQSGDADQLERTGAEVEQALAAMDESPSAREQLQTFRRACRPVAG